MAFPRRFLPPMSLLSAFEAAARHQSFTAAAAELSLTQSAVSRQIRALEELLGSPLFHRERQTVSLTIAGEVYARDVRDALRRVSTATLGFRANPTGGSLNLAILPTMGTRWLAPRLPQFQARHPGITINLSTRLQPFDFNFDTVDAAIHFGPREWSGAELDYLMGETVVPACSPGMRAEYEFSAPSDLLKAPLLHLVSRPDAWERWFAAMETDIDEVHGMLLDQFVLATQAASAGLGVALFPEFLIKPELERGELVLALDGRIKSAEHYYLAWPPTRANYAPLQTFRSWIIEEAKLYEQAYDF
jgi:DNA-binding transcriptional LysR family regulator